jgi:hypothetical protein
MLLNLIARGGDPVAALRHLLTTTALLGAPLLGAPLS